MVDRLYTQQQVKLALQTQGASLDEQKVLSAIAMVEAPSVNPPGYANMDLVGDEDLVDSVWGPSLSYFQIRSLKSHTGTGQFRDATRLVDQGFATRSALYIARNNGYEAWSTYKSGAYKAYLEDYHPPIGVYIVKSGDTLSQIAQRFGLTVSWIAQVNNISDPSKIKIGQTLHLYLLHTVKSGETLSGIGKQYAVPYEKIFEYNNLVNPNLITVNQVLKIPKVW